MCMKDAIQNCKTSLLLDMQFTQYSSYSNGSNLHQTVFSGTINGHHHLTLQSEVTNELP